MYMCMCMHMYICRTSRTHTVAPHAHACRTSCHTRQELSLLTTMGWTGASNDKDKDKEKEPVASPTPEQEITAASDTSPKDEDATHQLEVDPLDANVTPAHITSSRISV